MPINKNAYIRYQTLDRCFSNFGRKFFAQDLLEEVNRSLFEFNGVTDGIGRTQLFKDLKFMESEEGFSVPLERLKDGRKVFYRYENRDFSIKNNPLSHSEMSNFKTAIEVLSRFKGLPQFEWISEVLPVLNDKMGLVNDSKQVILFDSNIDYSGYIHIESIFQAIANKRVLQIEYRDFKNPESYQITLHPYILRQYNNRWFLLGLNEDLDNYQWIMALDRILKIKELDRIYVDYDYDWEDDYFYDIIGVSRYGEPKIIEIKLEFSERTAPYIKTKPLHPSQSKMKALENGNMLTKIKVIPNYELERLLLSYGEDVKVLSPKFFKEKIESRIKASLRRYKE